MLRKGFTLIELLIVITIIAILAGAAVPFVQEYVEDARLAKVRADMDVLSAALTRYEIERGYYDLENGHSQDDLVGPFIQRVIVDPWGQPYQIFAASSLIRSVGSEINVDRFFRPAMAPTRAYWIDIGLTGTIETNDHVRIHFTRPVDEATAIVGNFEALHGAGLGTPSSVELASDERVVIIKLDSGADLSVGNMIRATSALKCQGGRSSSEEPVRLRAFP